MKRSSHQEVIIMMSSFLGTGPPGLLADSLNMRSLIEYITDPAHHLRFRYVLELLVIKKYLMLCNVLKKAPHKSKKSWYLNLKASITWQISWSIGNTNPSDEAVKRSAGASARPSASVRVLPSSFILWTKTTCLLPLFLPRQRDPEMMTLSTKVS